MANSFGVTVTAKDSASGTLDAINKRMASINKSAERARAPFDELSKNFTKFSKVTGVDRIASGLGSVARAGFSAFQSVARIVEPLAAITGAASIAGMMRLATAWADFGSALGNTAARAGLTSDQLQVLQNAAQLAGVSADAMSGGMTNLRDNMVNAVGGKAPQVIGMLQALGLSLNDAKRYAGDTTKALPELADKIAGLKDPTLQAEAATALFGGAGEQLLPFLKKGSAGIAEYTERARKYGLINQDGVAAANQLREAQTSLSLAVAGLGYSIAQQLAPTIVPLLGQMADWIAANRDWISQGIGEKVQQFASYLQGVDWAKVGSSIEEVVHEVKGLVDALGGIVPVAETVVGFMAVAWLSKMLVPILAVSKALRGIPGQAAAAAAKANTELEGIGKGGMGGGLMKGLAGMAGLGLLEGVLSGQMGRDAAANLDERDRQQANPEPPQPDTRHWWERFYKPGPGLFSGSPAAAPSSTPGGAAGPAMPPNGIPHAGPTFGPQTPVAGSGKSGPQWGADLAQLQSYGWTKQQAAGILGNLDQESNGREGAVGDGGSAYGLGQWHADRQAAFAKQFRHDIHQSNHQEQIAFVNWELHNTEARAGGKLSQVGTARDSAAVIRKYYERPANTTGQEDQWRGDRADRILAQNKSETGNTERESGPALTLPPNAGTAANPGGAAPVTVNGQVGVNVRVAAPNGTTMSATQSGNALAPLKVEQTGVGYDDRRLS